MAIVNVKFIALQDWQTRRNDKRVENYWRGCDSPDPFQQHWNFIEHEYNDKTSNNGLDLMNPGFAFTTNLAKYLVPMECDIIDGQITNVRKS
jgi:hypothetical protein